VGEAVVPVEGCRYNLYIKGMLDEKDGICDVFLSAAKLTTKMPRLNTQQRIVFLRDNEHSDSNQAGAREINHTFSTESGTG
jgi:hypothetical protein